MFSRFLPGPALACALLLSLAVPAAADTPEGGYTEEGTPSYIVEDGKVDQGTYNGYRRYHNSCNVCHGPDGLGSSFAPALIESLENIDYWQFVDVVTNGRQGSANSVMPSFGEDMNVMMHIEDIYRYLKARSDEEIGRGRPTRIGR